MGPVEVVSFSPEQQVLSFQEGCAYLKYSHSAMYTALSRRQVPYLKVRGRIRFIKADLDRWLLSHRVAVADDHLGE